MAFQDRQYYRDGTGSGSNPLSWLWNGEVSLFTAFGIHVKAHASLIVFMALILIFGWGGGNLQSRIQSITALFAVVLLHEFGHCFAARWTGGSADQILMTPLGGLAMAYARRTPYSQFVTVAGGPAVNVIICVICGFGLYVTAGIWPLGPWQFGEVFNPRPGWFSVTSYLFMFYAISWALLIFNLLPVFPLDGGQLLQAALWKPVGYYKAMFWTVNVGIVGAALLILSGFTGFLFGGLFVVFIGIYCLMNCINMRRHLLAEGPWGFSEEESSIDYSAAYDNKIGRPKKKSGWQLKRAAKRVREQEANERREQEKIDAILAKVSAHGMNSLTWIEKRTLKKATERQRLAEEARVKRAYR